MDVTDREKGASGAKWSGAPSASASLRFIQPFNHDVISARIPPPEYCLVPVILRTLRLTRLRPIGHIKLPKAGECLRDLHKDCPAAVEQVSLLPRTERDMTHKPSAKPTSRRRTPRAMIGAGLLLLPAAAQTEGYSYTTFGTLGLVDMPTAQSAEDAELTATYSQFANTARTTLSFQITPRLSGSFRYSKIDDYSPGGGALFDRSFDMRYRLVDETDSRPAIAVGLQDFIGTGAYSSEYIVATKSVTPRLTFTSGIGWGRLGSYKGFSNPLGVIDDRFDTRPDRDFGRGGEIEAAGWFRGDAAFFGGWLGRRRTNSR